MNDPKIQLSQEELELVQNAGWLLTKNTIIDKVYLLFGDVAHAVRDEITGYAVSLSPEALAPAPKIARGENYQGLPYVMLDYPRLFGKEDILAIRCMFWWGNFFSVTLHLKGSYYRQYAPVIKDNLPLLAAHDFHLCVGSDEWRHDYAEDNYVPVEQLNNESTEKILSGNVFCKLSARISLGQWNQSKTALINLYKVVLTSIGSYQLPRR